MSLDLCAGSPVLPHAARSRTSLYRSDAAVLGRIGLRVAISGIRKDSLYG
jgi:hypothetical protein